MVRHQAVAVDDQAVAVAGLAQRLQESRAVAVVKEDCLLRVAACRDLVICPTNGTPGDPAVRAENVKSQESTRCIAHGRDGRLKLQWLRLPAAVNSSGRMPLPRKSLIATRMRFVTLCPGTRPAWKHRLQGGADADAQRAAHGAPSGFEVKGRAEYGVKRESRGEVAAASRRRFRRFSSFGRLIKPPCRTKSA